MGKTADATEWWSRMQIPDGLRDVRVVDAGECAWWTVKGYFHSLRVSTGWRRASVTALAFLTLAMYPLVVGCYALLPLLPQRHGWRTDHAVLYVAARRNYWTLDNHLSSRPGARHGERLRAAVLPQLIAAASAARVPVRFAAAHPTLLARYTRGHGGIAPAGRTLSGHRIYEWRDRSIFSTGTEYPVKDTELSGSSDFNRP